MAPYGVYGAAALDPYELEQSPFGVDELASPALTVPDPAQAGPPAAMRARILRLMEGANAAPPTERRSVMGGLMGGLEQPDYVPQVPEQVPGGAGPSGYLDRIAGNMAGISMPRANGNSSNLSQLLLSLVGNTARTWGSRRAKAVDERTAKQDVLERRAAIQNERNAAASERAREGRIAALKESSATEKKDRQEREGWVVVPAHVARAMGDPKLTGQKVPPSTYNSMLATYNSQERGSGDGEAGSSRKERVRLMEDFRSADARVGQMRRVLEKRRAAKPEQFIGKSKLENPAYGKWQEGLDRLETDLAEQEARAEAAHAGLTSIGAAPTGVHWQPAAAPADAPPPPPDAPAPLEQRETPQGVDTGNAGRVKELRAEARRVKRDLRATGPLANDRRRGAQQRMNEIQRELTTLGSSIDTVQGVEFQIERRPNGEPAQPAPAAPAAEGSTGNTGGNAYAMNKIAQAKAGGMTLAAFEDEVRANAAALRKAGHDPDEMIRLARRDMR